MKNPKPIKVWDTGTGGGVAGSRTPVRRCPPNGAYSLDVILISGRSRMASSLRPQVLGFSSPQPNRLRRLSLVYGTWYPPKRGGGSKRARPLLGNSMSSAKLSASEDGVVTHHPGFDSVVSYCFLVFGFTRPLQPLIGSSPSKP